MAFLFSYLSAIPGRTGIGKCWFLKTGENWSTHSKPSLSKVKKHHTLNSHTALVSVSRDRSCSLRSAGSFPEKWVLKAGVAPLLHMSMAIRSCVLMNPVRGIREISEILFCMTVCEFMLGEFCSQETKTKHIFHYGSFLEAYRPNSCTPRA